MDPTLVISILASIGGVSGITQFIKWVKNKRRKFKMISYDTLYHIRDDELIARVNMQVSNEKEDPLFITDILCTLKENEQKKGSRPHIFTERPTSPGFSEPIKIESRTTKQVRFQIKFKDIDIAAINRMGVASFMGFMKGGFMKKDLPLFYSTYRDFENNWNELPLEMLISMHINGKDRFHNTIGIDKEGKNNGVYGSFNVVDIKQIEKDYLHGK